MIWQPVSLWKLLWLSTWLLSAVLLIAILVPRQRLIFKSLILRWGLGMTLILPLSFFCPRFQIPVLSESRPNSTTPPLMPSEITGHDAMRQPYLTGDDAQRDSATTIPQISNLDRGISSSGSDQVIIEPVDAEPRTAPRSPLIPSGVQRSPEHANSNGTVPIEFMVLSVYVLGACILLGRLALGLCQLRRLRRRTRQNLEPEWSNDLAKICQALGLTRPIELCTSAEFSTPLTFGWRRPLLVIPKSLQSVASPAQRRAILLHELIHILRCDFVIQLGLQFACAVYWCQPLIWLLNRSLRSIQEELCDAECSKEFGSNSYGLYLVEIVQILKSRPASLALAMASRTRLERRIARVLTYQGNESTRVSRKVAGLLLAVATLGASIFLLIEPVTAQRPETGAEKLVSTTQPDSDSLPQEEKLTPAPADSATIADQAVDAGSLMSQVPFPRILVQLRDRGSKQVVADEKVRVRRLNIEKVPRRFDDQVWDVTTDNRGILAISLPHLAENQKSIVLDFHVAGRASALETLEIQRNQSQSSLTTLNLWPSLDLVTRVFDAEGRPAADGRVRLLADIDANGFDIWEAYETCDPEGLLTIHVPRDSTFGLLVTSDRGSPHRIVYPAGTTRLNDIFLNRGSVVSGQLIDRDGKPIPDCRVVMEADDSQAVDTEYRVKQHGLGELSLSFVRTTDHQGGFQFPPMQGSVRIYLGCDDRPDLRNRLVPVSLDLPLSGDTWAPLMPSLVGIVSGTVRWPDGKPAAGMQIEALIPPRRSRSYITLGSAKADSEGKYQLSVPYPLDEVRLSSAGLRGPDGKYWRASVVTKPYSNRTGTMASLSRYLGQPLTIDWEMTADREGGNTANSAIEPGWEPLALLEQQLSNATEQSRDSTLELGLEFEAKHRGTRMALGGLHYIMRQAELRGDEKRSAARLKAIHILGNHYLKHPDLDHLITGFSAGSGAPGCESLLLRVSEESPFDYVRATALFELARQKFLNAYLKDKIYNGPQPSAQQQADMISMQKSESTKDWLRENYAHQARMRQFLEKMDSAELQQSALEILERVTNRYTGVVTPIRYWESVSRSGWELKLVDRAESGPWRIRTIAERAAILRFQKTRLQVGMMAPEIEGWDFQQKPIRLSQFRGKVVLVTMTLGNSENELYGRGAKLIDSVKDERFVCLSVIPGAGSGGASVRYIVESGKVTWPIIRDTADDDIAHQWCQGTFPVSYLIDAQGLIRHFATNDSAGNHLQTRVQELLAEQKP